MSHTENEVVWDAYARCYDTLNQLQPYVGLLEEVLWHIPQTVTSLLDAGCGTGNLLAKIMASTQAPTSITGIDSSATMLEYAKRKCRDSGTTLAYANLDRRLPYRDGSFACIVCVNALYAVTSPGETLQELERVLAPGGTLIVVTPKQGFENGIILKAHCNSDKPDAYWYNLHESLERERFLVQEALGDSLLADAFLELAGYNRTIAASRTFHFFTGAELASAVRKTGLTVVSHSLVYAGQNLLLTARKP